jgi:hypothetical protein
MFNFFTLIKPPKSEFTQGKRDTLENVACIAHVLIKLRVQNGSDGMS